MLSPSDLPDDDEDDREKRLPEWARRKLKLLRRDLRHANDRWDKLSIPDAPIVLSPYGDSIGIEDMVVQFGRGRIGCLHVSLTEGGIQVRATRGRLVIVPHVSNQVEIRRLSE